MPATSSRARTSRCSTPSTAAAAWRSASTLGNAAKEVKGKVDAIITGHSTVMTVADLRGVLGVQQRLPRHRAGRERKPARRVDEVVCRLQDSREVQGLRRARRSAPEGQHSGRLRRNEIGQVGRVGQDSPPDPPDLRFRRLDVRLLRADADAGGEMAGHDLLQWRFDLSARRHRVGAARVKAATGRRIDRRRHVALEHDAPRGAPRPPDRAPARRRSAPSCTASAAAS